MLMALLRMSKMGEEGGIRCLCSLCYAFSKGKNPPKLFDIDPFVSFCFICSSLYKIKLKRKYHVQVKVL